MRLITIITALLLSACSYSVAQTPLQEVVYLRNGSIIRGSVIEMVIGESIKIQTADGSLYVYPMTEVLKVTKEAPVSYYSQNYNVRSSSRSAATSGYEGIADFGYVFGTGEWGFHRIEVNTTQGYRFNPYFYLGGGLGFHYYHEPDEVLMPLFADIRCNFTKGKIVPFASMRVGYSFNLTDGVSRCGAYFAPSAGVKFFADKKTNFFVSAGYTIQWIDGRSDIFDYYWLDDDSYQNVGGVSIKVGINF